MCKGDSGERGRPDRLRRRPAGGIFHHKLTRPFGESADLTGPGRQGRLAGRPFGRAALPRSRLLQRLFFNPKGIGSFSPALARFRERPNAGLPQGKVPTLKELHINDL